MKVLVCGGRNYADKRRVDETLSTIHTDRGPVEVIFHGAASGADTLAGAWAARNGVSVSEFPADWNAHGRSAGPIRNREMLAIGQPDLVVGFPGGRGTADMLRQARNAGVEVMVVPAASGVAMTAAPSRPVDEGKMLAYPIEMERDGEYFLGTLVDFPECNPVGRTEGEMLADARHSLEEMIAAKMEDHEDIPPPSPAKGRPVVLIPNFLRP